MIVFEANHVSFLQQSWFYTSVEYVKPVSSINCEFLYNSFSSPNADLHTLDGKNYLQIRLVGTNVINPHGFGSLHIYLMSNIAH